MQNRPNLNPNVTSAGWRFIGKIVVIVACVLAGIALCSALMNSSEPPHSSQDAPNTKSTRRQQSVVGTKRDRIPVNTVCYLGPAGVFDTSDDVTLFMEATINGDHFAANNMLGDNFHFWLREKASVNVLYHGPYQGYVAPDAPQSTLDALRQFEICQIQILDGTNKNKIGWVVDTELRCPTQKGR